ncbi:MAG: penicillin acylase family protein [Paracoccus sp. (in: a-proteobacteria)]|uniref:penicillin acylase family protein n=1 Tax=Paracoccus sp. TaxID=267 RepID=UPI0026E0ED57|nr:penicillin acylase family protein [Paracoccus sp. (in: a-proteobacteria)]MDO5613905.1 penicillin acylase family protein [Paracoccus sp. (in: a-proteobacteria)]
MTHLMLPGLEAPGEIRVDRWGVPHIRAASLHDAFFLQGFNAGRDRLWQVDLWRKRGLGLLAGDFGPGYLAQDRAARLFLYRGDMDEEWRHYGPDAKEICTAFAAGLNAAVDAVLAGDLPLPPEFARFGTRPAHWQPQDVVRIRIHALSRNALSEWARWQMVRAMGPEDGAAADQLRTPLDPPLAPADWGPMADADLPDAAMDVYRLAMAPVSFARERLAATLDQAEEWARTEQGRVVRTSPVEGSNNWAVAATHTATGRPLMASDPHRALSTPSLRYLVHLEAPGLSLIGAGEPSSPGIMAGHNGHAAFSLTIFPADQEDLLVLNLDGDGWCHDGGTQAFRHIDETIPVRGYADQPVRLRFAGKAPVLWVDDRHALAIRTVATDAGTAPYMACLAAMRARTPDAFRDALRGWGSPTVNQIYTDVNGALLWQAAGFVPQRRAGCGVVPAPGDGSCDWTGFMTAADLPGHDDPACGFVLSANEMNVPHGWDHAIRPISHEWHHGTRAARIAQVLADAPTDVAGSVALQADVFSDLALRLCACLPDEGGAARLLRNWDGRQTADSGAALLYGIWTAQHLDPSLIARLPMAAQNVIERPDVGVLVELFEGSRPDLARVLGLDRAARAALLSETLLAAWDQCRRDHGDDPDRWNWGDLHAALFRAASGDQAAGPLPVGGGRATVMLSSYEAGGFQPANGASVRMVVDVGGWDNSRWINAPGQSGDLAGPHGGDLAPIWAAGGTVPMLFSAGAVDMATEALWHLTPR